MSRMGLLLSTWQAVPLTLTMGSTQLTVVHRVGGLTRKRYRLPCWKRKKNNPGLPLQPPHRARFGGPAHRCQKAWGILVTVRAHSEPGSKWSRLHSGSEHSPFNWTSSSPTNSRTRRYFYVGILSFRPKEGSQVATRVKDGLTFYLPAIWCGHLPSYPQHPRTK